MHDDVSEFSDVQQFDLKSVLNSDTDYGTGVMRPRAKRCCYVRIISTLFSGDIKTNVRYNTNYTDKTL
jgi:hypothetical protein